MFFNIFIIRICNRWLSECINCLKHNFDKTVYTVVFSYKNSKGMNEISSEWIKWIKIRFLIFIMIIGIFAKIMYIRN